MEVVESMVNSTVPILNVPSVTASDKFASFIKTYIAMGGHQIQLNSVNLQTLKDAKIHPENYERLVVRIWGWSAYFVELDEEFQNHVMARQEYSV